MSLQPSATVILAAIGRLDRIVACTKYCADVCPEISKRDTTIVADSWTASTGEIVAARPDLVIAAVPYQEKAVTEILKSGARFLGLAPHTLADIYTDIAAIAGIMGVPDRGDKVIREMLREIEAIRQRTNAAMRPRVFCEEWGKPLIASQPWVAELVEAAGGEFVCTPGEQTSAAAILAEDPDGDCCRLVRRGRPGSSGENSSRTGLDRDARRERRPRLLHSRRISEYSSANPRPRPVGAGCGHSPRRFSTSFRSKMHGGRTGYARMSRFA